MASVTRTPCIGLVDEHNKPEVVNGAYLQSAEVLFIVYGPGLPALQIAFQQFHISPLAPRGNRARYSTPVGVYSRIVGFKFLVDDNEYVGSVVHTPKAAEVFSEAVMEGRRVALAEISNGDNSVTIVMGTLPPGSMVHVLTVAVVPLEVIGTCHCVILKGGLAAGGVQKPALPPCPVPGSLMSTLINLACARPVEDGSPLKKTRHCTDRALVLPASIMGHGFERAEFEMAVFVVVPTRSLVSVPTMPPAWLSELSRTGETTTLAGRVDLRTGVFTDTSLEFTFPPVDTHPVHECGHVRLLEVEEYMPNSFLDNGPVLAPTDRPVCTALVTLDVPMPVSEATTDIYPPILLRILKDKSGSMSNLSTGKDFTASRNVIQTELVDAALGVAWRGDVVSVLEFSDGVRHVCFNGQSVMGATPPAIRGLKEAARMSGAPAGRTNLAAALAEGVRRPLGTVEGVAVPPQTIVLLIITDYDVLETESDEAVRIMHTGVRALELEGYRVVLVLVGLGQSNTRDFARRAIAACGGLYLEDRSSTREELLSSVRGIMRAAHTPKVTSIVVDPTGLPEQDNRVLGVHANFNAAMRHCESSLVLPTRRLTVPLVFQGPREGEDAPVVYLQFHYSGVKAPVRVPVHIGTGTRSKGPMLLAVAGSMLLDGLNRNLHAKTSLLPTEERRAECAQLLERVQHCSVELCQLDPSTSFVAVQKGVEGAPEEKMNVQLVHPPPCSGRVSGTNQARADVAPEAGAGAGAGAAASVPHMHTPSAPPMVQPSFGADARDRVPKSLGRPEGAFVPVPVPQFVGKHFDRGFVRLAKGSRTAAYTTAHTAAHAAAPGSATSADIGSVPSVTASCALPMGTGAGAGAGLGAHIHGTDTFGGHAEEAPATTAAPPRIVKLIIGGDTLGDDATVFVSIPCTDSEFRERLATASSSGLPQDEAATTWFPILNSILTLSGAITSLGFHCHPTTITFGISYKDRSYLFVERDVASGRDRISVPPTQCTDPGGRGVTISTIRVALFALASDLQRRTRAFEALYELARRGHVEPPEDQAGIVLVTLKLNC